MAFRGYQAGAVDYITKPFDPWVLRSKVAVFIDLWIKKAELTAQAAERTALREAVTRALALLDANPPDPSAAAAILHEVHTPRSIHLA
jgi:DNA-binding response OmpR family regulator